MTTDDYSRLNMGQEDSNMAEIEIEFNGAKIEDWHKYQDLFERSEKVDITVHDQKFSGRLTKIDFIFSDYGCHKLVLRLLLIEQLWTN